MKKMKKIFAVILSLAMLLGMSVTTFAATPSANDQVDVKITGINNGAHVTLYRIAEGVYGKNGATGFIEYKWVDGTEFANPDVPTADEINLIAQGINAGTIEAPVVNQYTMQPSDGGEYVYKAKAGAYIAIISGSDDDDSVYNPILLTASYGDANAENGTLSGGNINAYSRYLGTQAVAKKSDPAFDKSITGATEDTATDGKKIATGSVGQVLTYTLDVTIPSYPSNAKNKTFFISDTMVTGLTFDYSTLEVLIEGQTVTRDGNSFKLGDKVIAEAAETENGFNLNFTYDNLISNPDTGAIYVPTVTYKAIINSSAVVGVDGNPNDATLYYAKKPNEGESWDTPNEKPNGDKAQGVNTLEDKEIVYTYQLAFLKTGEGDDKDKLAGARFGIYTSEACEEKDLIDTVTTNESGLAISTRVGAGTYYVKEIWAPDGYSLNDKVYEVEASWVTATTTTNSATEIREYVTDPEESEDGVQVGWIKDGVFYNYENKPEGTDNVDVFPAYTKTATTTSSSVTDVKVNGSGTVTAIKELGGTSNVDSVPNTKLASLPSTGGIGTTIFTIGGCAIMIIAAGLFFASRRKSDAK